MTVPEPASTSEGIIPNNGVITRTSKYSFLETLQRLTAALENRGIKIFARIDQDREARTVGLDMPPTTLLLFGNPKAGTPLMLAHPAVALDLPLKVLVTESIPGEVKVHYNAALYITGRHGMDFKMADALAPIEGLIAQTIA
ncbi:MAG: DUF302 domain-containing protein [Desulfobulbaceae bacterium]|nr:DUF302 domain-containing protein [Desulfobulbaceae bacterium]